MGLVLGLGTMDQLGDADAAMGRIARLPNTPQQRRTDARVQDNVRSLPVTIPLVFRALPPRCRALDGTGVSLPMFEENRQLCDPVPWVAQGA